MRNVFALALLVVGMSASASGPGSEVSRSRGRGGGVVVLWPRIVPETQDPSVVGLATRLQERLLIAATAQAVANRVEIRPSPERVCPLNGCRATSVGLLLGHQDGGCVALAVVGPPGAETQRLVPLAGKFQMDDAALPFREPPEGKVVISEFVPCVELEQMLDEDALSRLVVNPVPIPASAVPPPIP